jgi:hypothetical protein
MGPATETEMDTLTLAWFTGPPAEGDTPGRGIKTSFHRLRWTVGTCCQTVQASSGNRRNPRQRHVCLLVTEIGVGFRQCLHGAVGHELIANWLSRPSWPLTFQPQPKTSPCATRARLWPPLGCNIVPVPPAAIALTFLINEPSFFPPFTAAAVDLSPRRR